MAKRNLRNMGQITSKLNMQYATGKYLQEKKNLLKIFQSKLVCGSYEPTKLQDSKLGKINT
jgi:hypothetical protein